MVAARNICDIRQSHAKQKARFLASLKKLREQYQNYTNHGFDKQLRTAITDSWTIVKSCIDFKEGFTYPHNVALLSVPEDVYSGCYSLGASLVESALFNLSSKNLSSTSLKKLPSFKKFYYKNTNCAYLLMEAQNLHG
ncbi:MAG: hypothetical protein V7L27_26870 [Nostoc sp.]|uniref:hypothetical protein n=1 Tax=Nostoc sp. TaxID=1180 RepID=UPI002FFAC466